MASLGLGTTSHYTEGPARVIEQSLRESRADQTDASHIKAILGGGRAVASVFGLALRASISAAIQDLNVIS